MTDKESEKFERACEHSAAIANLFAPRDQTKREAISTMLFDLLLDEEPRKVAEFFSRWPEPLEFFVGVASEIEPEMRKRGLGDLAALKSEFAALILKQVEPTERPQ